MRERGRGPIWGRRCCGISSAGHKIICFILKFYPCLPKQNKGRDVLEKKIISLIYCPSTCLPRSLILTRYCVNETSNAGHIKCSRGPKAPHPYALLRHSEHMQCVCGSRSLILQLALNLCFLSCNPWLSVL